jgi:hypothetical protein
VKRLRAVVMATALLVAGCASSVGQAPGSGVPAREECLRTGGAWREVLSFCEYR